MAGLAVLACGHRGAAARASPQGRSAPSRGAPAAAQPPRAAGGARPAGALLRVAVLPIDNKSGVAASSKELQAILERQLAARLDVVTGPSVEEFLSRHRLRYTGGIDADAARAARDELGLDAFVLTTLEAYRPGAPPVMGLTMRLVATGDVPVILWMEHAVRGGEDRPGLLRLGVLEQVEQVRRIVLDRILESLDRYLRGERATASCPAGRFQRPKLRFRSTLLDQPRLTVAVVPFLNQTSRRNAGDLVALEFVRQLVQAGRYAVLEPGVVRDYMLRARIMVPGGVSLETTRLFMGALEVDLVVSGVVLDYQDSWGPQGPTVRFSATMLDGGSGQVAWHSSSSNHGDDGVFAFGLGRVRTSGELACRMVAGVVDRMGRRGSDDAPPRAASMPMSPGGTRLGRPGGEPERR